MQAALLLAFSSNYIVRHPKHIPITLVPHSPCEYYSSLWDALGIINVKQMLDAFPGAPALIAGVCTTAASTLLLVWMHI